MIAIILILLLGMFSGNKNKGKKKMNFQTIKEILLRNGFNPKTVNMFVAQAMLESGTNTEVEEKMNNYSGIQFINKHYQKNATQGPKKSDGGYFAIFATVDDWAKDFKRILSLGNEKPINASNPIELVSRLKKNNYFGAGSESAYLAGIKSNLNKIV